MCSRVKEITAELEEDAEEEEVDSDSTNSEASDNTLRMGRRIKKHERKIPGVLTSSTNVLPRPKASNGFWLAILLPLALSVYYVRSSICQSGAASPSYLMMTICAIGMGVEAICFYLYLFVDTHIQLKMLISFVPGILTTCLLKYVLQESWQFGVFFGFAATFCYQSTYIKMMRRYPRSFSYGEAALLAQGVVLFAINAVINIRAWLFDAPVKDAGFVQLNAIMMASLFYVAMVCWLLNSCTSLQKPAAFYALMISLVLMICCVPVTHPIPIIAVFRFIFNNEERIKILTFFLLLVVVTIFVVWLQLRGDNRKPSTRLRKIFHLLLALVFVPGLVCDCAFIYLATGVALAFCIVLELVRSFNVPPLAAGLKNAFAVWSDEKDAGELALTPFCLLIGCSLPIWIHPCPCSCTSLAISVRNAELLPLLSGILTVALGDTAASFIGSKYGRFKWSKSGAAACRTIEGSVAFVCVLLATVMALDLSGIIFISTSKLWALFAASCVTAFVEAHTAQIDNLVLPLVFYICVNLGFMF